MSGFKYVVLGGYERLPSHSPLSIIQARCKKVPCAGVDLCIYVSVCLSVHGILATGTTHSWLITCKLAISC